MGGTRRVALTVYAAIIAISAYAGAIGLAGGSIDMTAKINDRLPFQSPAFGGLALALIVGVPNTLLAVYAWRGDARTGTAALAAGALLVGWIAVEIAFMRELSWLQPTFVVVGATLIVIGTQRRSTREPDAQVTKGPGR